VWLCQKVKQLGGTVDDTELVEGIVFEKGQLVKRL
jgi:chaperonin GroEL (HSP60 family)